MPIVSVIIPAYNAEKYLPEAIESILNQTFSDFELIIVDDCSGDDSWKCITAYAKKDKRIVPLRNKNNVKLSYTLNRGIEHARGKYIARMDADDFSLPKRLEKQVRFMEKNKSVGIVGGTMEIMNERGVIKGKRRYPLTDAAIRKNIFWYSPFSHPLIMMRKSVLDDVGYYNDFYNPAEDYELYFRIGKVAKFANLPETLLKYRIIPKSMTTGSTKRMEEKTIAIRELYAQDPSYKMTLSQKFYNGLHKISLAFIPSTMKMKLFHIVRNAVS